MMKKYLLFLCGLCFVINANAEGVVLSDTSISEEDVYTTDTDDDVVQNTTNKSDGYIEQQIKPAFKNVLSNDTSDPLYLIVDNKFLSDTYVSFIHDRMRVGEFLGYGINNNFAIHANMLYQFDFSGHREYGFSATEIGGTYRMSHGFNKSKIISDALFGLKLWGSKHVRTPEYADSSYYAGLRFGRQYAGVTLSGTAKSTWVFDDERGLSYLDFIPEVYFRFKYDWRAGLGLDIRRSTNTHLLSDQEWLNLKLLRQFGNTQYVARFDYEFESGDTQIGLNIKILF